MSAYKKQIGGSHYQNFTIQPAEFSNKNKLLWAEGEVIKYICRHKEKGRKKDLEKAKHVIDMIIERDYTEPYDATKDVEKLQKYTESWIEGYKKWKANK